MLDYVSKIWEQVANSGTLKEITRLVVHGMEKVANFELPV